MNRLLAQWQRLFLTTDRSEHPGTAPALQDAAGRTRALLIELSRPADWPALAAVWQGVQQDLGLPAPAIAVSGTEGFQLWFALAEPLKPAQGLALLQAICTRYLPDVAAQRLHLQAGEQVVGGRAGDTAGERASERAGGRMAIPLPPQLQAAPDQWSAFVSQDLAPVFADSPWLDIEPGVEAQADVLAAVGSISPDALQQALALLAPAPSEPGQPATAAPARAPTAVPALRPALAQGTHTQAALDFLLQVMQDSAAPLPQRIEAAKALLQHGT